MPEMHLRQLGFTYSACGSFTKKQRMQKFKQTGDSQYIYQNELDKACFPHDMAYGDFKDLTRRIASDKTLHDKAFNIAKIPKYDGYQRGLASVVYKFFDKKTCAMHAGSETLWSETLAMQNKFPGSGIKNENISNKELAQELHQLIIKKFKKRKAQSPFIDNIWGADLADMQLISKFNEEVQFLLCVIDIFSKYAQVIPLKDKKGITITNAFPKILDESNHKPNKKWVDKDSKFYKRSMKAWLEKNAIDMYSNERKKNEMKEKYIHKYMTSISKNVHTDKLDVIVNKYNNTYHSTIKMKPINVKSNTYINSSKEINDKDLKFKIGDIARISKYKNIFAKGYGPN